MLFPTHRDRSSPLSWWVDDVSINVVTCFIQTNVGLLRKSMSISNEEELRRIVLPLTKS